MRVGCLKLHEALRRRRRGARARCGGGAAATTTATGTEEGRPPHVCECECGKTIVEGAISLYHTVAVRFLPPGVKSMYVGSLFLCLLSSSRPDSP